MAIPHKAPRPAALADDGADQAAVPPRPTKTITVVDYTFTTDVRDFGATIGPGDTIDALPGEFHVKFANGAELSIQRVHLRGVSLRPRRVEVSE